MGKFILCSGTRAKEPLYLEMTDTTLYTIEELCFYLYQHIYLITDEFFSDYVINWIEKETGQKKLAVKLRELHGTRGSVKDKVICVLCSTDYYTEKEMKQLIMLMDQMEGLPLIKRRKIKADSYMQYKRYVFAAKEYEGILESKDASILTSEEYGNLLHNYGVVLLYVGALKEAALKMKEAYQSNQNEESLKSYLLILRMMGNTETIEKEEKDLLVSEQMVTELNKIMKDAASMEMNHPFHMDYRKLHEDKENQDAKKFFRDLNQMLNKWIGEYRNKVN